MELAEFAQFNTLGWRKVVDGLEEAGPFRVDLFREKTSRTSVKKYYTFVGEDGKRYLCQRTVAQAFPVLRCIERTS
jgi:hypothetical protein